MTRPPLANLFAVHDVDPFVLHRIAADLMGSGEFAEVWHPAPGWVAAAQPLPGGEADGDVACGNGLAFAEGRERFSTGASGTQHPLSRTVAELADVAPERLGALPGDFGFIRFRAGGTATVVRSCGGLVPFYLWQSEGRVAVSTRLGDLVRYLPDEPRLDPLVNAVWTRGYPLFPDGRSFLAGVSVLERGCSARIERGRPINIRRYWNPRPERVTRPSSGRASEHAERLRALLIQKLTRDLDPEGGNLLMLSGGVDSSSLAALAASVVGRKVWTLSLLPLPEDLFQQEMSYIASLASRVRFERSWRMRLSPELLIGLSRAAPRIVFQLPHPALCALPGIRREAEVRVLFGGEFADEVCGSSLTMPDWAAHTSLSGLIAGMNKLPSGPRDVLRWMKYRVLSAVGHPMLPFPKELPEFIRPEIQEEYRVWLERRRHGASRDADPLRHLALRAELDGFLAMNWEATSALSIRRSFPFFNREVVELAFECHPTELVGPGTKKLLRTALRDDVPQKNLERPDKGGWGAYLRNVQLPWHTPLPAELGSLLREDWYPRPPRMLNLSETRGLTQLLIFGESLCARRLERGGPAAATPLPLKLEASNPF